ncbi:MAG: proline--tRNA ligase [Methanomassiliicoccales archaeon]|nr:MAG: proline--tRNA ligase [Methanomassiliicoccales archaeon]
MRKKENFSEWYPEVIEKANLSDKRYPIKGMNVWTPYGWKAMRLIDRFIRREFDATGHDEVCFPLLIPEDQFKKEADHIKGFEEWVYWVTHAGTTELDVRLLLRPTSETAMYPVFALWVRSHADLPLKIYQIVNVFRYETKQTRAFMRVREIHFFESHTCHDSFEDAERQIAENIEIIERLGKEYCLPYILCRRPEWDKFAGAYYTIGIDSLMPTGRTLQLGSIHQYRTNFSEPYNITYEDEKGEHKPVHQTTFGMAERLLGAVIAIHGDDKGVLFPPQIAPIQVVIVPILAKGSKTEVTDQCNEVYHELKESGVRVHLDERDLRPGNKFYDWEAKGVPLRIEIGKQDLTANVVTVVRRDNMNKDMIQRKGMASKVKEMLKQIQGDLRTRSEEEMRENIVLINSLDEVKSGVMMMGWCGEEECGHEIEDQTNLSILGEPVGSEEFEGKCIVCGKETKTPICAAKTY